MSERFVPRKIKACVAGSIIVVNIPRLSSNVPLILWSNVGFGVSKHVLEFITEKNDTLTLVHACEEARVNITWVLVIRHKTTTIGWLCLYPTEVDYIEQLV